MNELVLTSDSLLSKWGFNDGDEPDALLDRLDAIGWTGGDGYLPGDVWHTVLCRLVREHLIPRLDQDVDVTILETNHNPVRAHTVDGADVTHLWRQTRDPSTCPHARVGLSAHRRGDGRDRRRDAPLSLRRQAS